MAPLGMNRVSRDIEAKGWDTQVIYPLALCLALFGLTACSLIFG